MNALKVAQAWRRLDEWAWNPYRCLNLLEAKGDGELREWSMRLAAKLASTEVTA